MSIDLSVIQYLYAGCELPHNIWNYTLPVEQSFISDGDIITVRCEEDYLNIGDSELTCSVSGEDQYQGKSPNCVASGEICLNF